MTALHIPSLQLIKCKNSRYSFAGKKSLNLFRQTAQSRCISIACDLLQKAIILQVWGILSGTLKKPSSWFP